VIRKLDRYMFFSFLFPFLLCMVLIVAMIMVVQTSERLSSLLRYNGPDPLLKLLGRYYLCSIPVLTYMVVPIITFSGAIVALVRLARQNELMAMQASGISLKRIAIPLLAGGLVAAALAACLQEIVVPASAREMQRMTMRLFGSKAGDPMVYKNVFAVDLETSTWLHAAELDYREKVIRNAEVDFPPAAGGMRASPMIIDVGRWKNRQWLVSGRQMVVGSDGLTNETFIDRPLSVSFTPEDLCQLPSISYRSLGELRKFAHQFPSRARVLNTEIHKRLAYPFMNLILLLLAIPLVVQPGGQTSIRGIGLAVLAVLGFYVVMLATLDFGYRGYLPPIVAAWLAPGIFTAIGAWMYRHFHG